MNTIQNIISKRRFQLIHLFQEMMFYTPIFSLYLVKHDVSLRDIVISQSMYTIAMLLAEIPTGVLADRFGQRVSSAVGAGLYAIGYAALLLFPTTAVVYLMNILWGVGGAFTSGSLEALEYEEFTHGNTAQQSTFQQYYSRLQMFGRIGAVISAVVAGVLLQVLGEWSYRLSIFLTMTSYLVSLGLLHTYRPHHDPQTTDSQLFSIIEDGYKAITGSKWLIALTIFMVLTLNGQYFLRSVYPLLFEMRSIQPLLVGVALSLANIGNASLLFSMSRLKDELPLRTSLLFLALAQGSLYLLLSIVQGWAVVVVFLMLGSLFDLDRVLISNFANAQLPSSARSTALSFMSFVRSIAQTMMRIGLGVLVGGAGVVVTLQFVGGYLVVGAGVSLLLFVGVARFVSERQLSVSSL